MALVNWIESKLNKNYSETATGLKFDYFSGTFEPGSVLDISKELWEKSEHSKNNRTTWYEWQEGLYRYELKVEAGKYKNQQAKVVMWRYNALAWTLNQLSQQGNVKI